MIIDQAAAGRIVLGLMRLRRTGRHAEADQLVHLLDQLDQIAGHLSSLINYDLRAPDDATGPPEPHSSVWQSAQTPRSKRERAR